MWHRRVAKWLATQRINIEVLWVHNGALPWLPLAPYVRLTSKIVWGPVGGGEAAPKSALRTLSLYSRWREGSRSLLSHAMLWGKSFLGRMQGTNIVPLARTLEAHRLLAKAFPTHSIPIIPEILRPIEAARIERRTSETPRFIWIGQEVPRKNLPLALGMFSYLRTVFPEATLDVFGTDSGGRHHQPGVTYHGWVSNIPWHRYQDAGILLLTSFREGLPSAVLEALSRGMLCVASEVGALPSLNVNTLLILPRQEYPHYSTNTYNMLTVRIQEHLKATQIELREVNYEGVLRAHLAQSGID